jgi:hypothetical protein
MTNLNHNNPERCPEGCQCQDSPDSPEHSLKLNQKISRVLLPSWAVKVLKRERQRSRHLRKG